MKNRYFNGGRCVVPSVTFIFLAMLVLAAGGCASLAPAVTTDTRVQYSDWLSSRQALRLQQKEHWRWQGRAVVASKVKARRIAIDWRENKGLFNLELSGPIGIGKVKIMADSTGVTLVKGKDRVKAENIDALLLRYFDWPLVSIDQLRDWLWGMASDVNSSRFFANGYLQQLSVNGWVLEYDDYWPVNGVALPHKLRATKGSSMIKLKITRWQLF